MQGFSGANLLYNDHGLFAMEGHELSFTTATADPPGGTGGEAAMCSSELLGLVQEPQDGPSDLAPYFENEDPMVAAPAVVGSSLPNHNGSTLDGSLQKPTDSGEMLGLHTGGQQSQLPPCTCSHLPWQDGESESNPFAFEENLALQDVLPHPQLTNPCPRCCNNIDSIFLEQPSNLVGPSGGMGAGTLARVSASVAVAATENSFHGSDTGSGSGSSSCAVTTQWEESLQDLQSLLAHHSHQSQVMSPGALPMQIEPAGGRFDYSSGSNFRASGSYQALEKDRTGVSGVVGGFSFGKFPAVDTIGESELLNLVQFPRACPTMPSVPAQRALSFQPPAGPVSMFSSKPAFSKGGQMSSSPNPPSAGGLYPPTDTSSFLYQPPPNFMTINPPGLGFSSYINQVNPPGLLQKQPQSYLMRPPSLSDLEQSRDRRVGESSNARGSSTGSSTVNMGSVAANSSYPQSFFESGSRRSGSEAGLLSGKPGSEPRGIHHFATERQRREFLNEKYQTLRSLVPNPSKADRASIVADAIEYVKDLKRSVQELNILVLEKRREVSLKEAAAHQESNANKRRRDADDNLNAAFEGGGTSRDSAVSSHDRPSFDASHLRSSWQQRTSQSTGTQVDVRIVHDDVTIKLIKPKRPGSQQVLLQTLVTLLELHLDLQNANGATIHDHDVYCFNTKMSDGSSPFPGFVITKLFEAVDRE